MRRAALLVVGLLLVGCGGASSGDGGAFTCSIDALEGTWRLHYEERPEGTCGPMPDETTAMGSPLSTACTVLERHVSPDRCMATIDVSCLTADKLGATRSVMTLTHMSDTFLAGSYSVAVIHMTLGDCSSRYGLTATRL